MNDLIILCGGNNRYQKLLLLALILILFIQGFGGVLLPYIYFVPDFYCIDNTNFPASKFKCTETEACKNPGGFEVLVARSSIVSIHKLWCDRAYIKSTAISVINFGASTIFYGINMLADRYGRNIMLRLSAYFLIIISFACIFVTDFYLNTGLTLLIWLSLDTTMSLAFIFFMEFSADSIREKSNAILFYAYTFGVISAHVINIVIRDFRMMYLCLFVFSVCFLFVYFFMNETPYFYFEKGDFENFKKVVLKIFKVNKKQTSTTQGNKYLVSNKKQLFFLPFSFLILRTIEERNRRFIRKSKTSNDTE